MKPYTSYPTAGLVQSMPDCTVCCPSCCPPPCPPPCPSPAPPCRPLCPPPPPPAPPVFPPLCLPPVGCCCCRACCYAQPICAEFSLADMDYVSCVRVLNLGVQYVRSRCCPALAVNYAICVNYVDNAGCPQLAKREGCIIFSEICGCTPCEQNVIVRFDQPCLQITGNPGSFRVCVDSCARVCL